MTKMCVTLLSQLNKHAKLKLVLLFCFPSPLWSFFGVNLAISFFVYSVSLSTMILFPPSLSMFVSDCLLPFFKNLHFALGILLQESYVFH